MGEDRVVEGRVGELEGWAKAAEKRLEDSERRHTEAEKRMEKFDEATQRMQQDMANSREVQVEMRTLIGVGNRDTAETKQALYSFKETYERAREEDRKEAERKREAAERERAEEYRAAKAQKPTWLMVWVSVGLAAIGVGGLILKLWVAKP